MIKQTIVLLMLLCNIAAAQYFPTFGVYYDNRKIDFSYIEEDGKPIVKLCGLESTLRQFWICYTEATVEPNIKYIEDTCVLEMPASNNNHINNYINAINLMLAERLNITTPAVKITAKCLNNNKTIVEMVGPVDMIITLLSKHNKYSYNNLDCTDDYMMLYSANLNKMFVHMQYNTKEQKTEVWKVINYYYDLCRISRINILD